MRIISGEHKGKTIPVIGSFSGRPTTDYAREALFNILVNKIDFSEIAVLDLFAGTGSVSYEFASRGCPSVTAVEVDSRSVAFITKTAASFGFGKFLCLRADVRNFLKQDGAMFDVIFADPPYELPWLSQLPDMVLESGRLVSGGLFILEHPGEIRFGNLPGYVETRNYSKVHFSFFSF